MARMTRFCPRRVLLSAVGLASVIFVTSLFQGSNKVPDSLSSDTSVIEIQQNITASETTRVAPSPFPPPPPLKSGILESGTLEGEPAANSTGVEGWMWIEETLEEKKRRMRTIPESQSSEAGDIHTLRDSLFASEMNVGGRKPDWLKPEPCGKQDASCWDHCLPFRGETNTSCASATLFDLQRESAGKFCHASVLHLMLEDFLTVIHPGWR